jgi:WD40 repeat protein
LGKLNVHPGQNLYNARFSPDGAFFVTASQDRTAKIWNASTGALVRTLSGNNSLVIDAVWSNDGQSIWTSGYDKHVRQYNVSDGSLLWDSGELPSLCLNAAMSQDGATLLVDMHGVSPITINTSTKQINALGDGFDWAEQVAAVSDGTMLVGDGGGPTIINPATRAVILRLTGLGNAASAVAASPNAQWIFAGGDGGALAVWNRSTGQKTQLPNQSGYVSSLTISGDGNHLFVASGNQVNAYDLRPLGSNQVPTLLTTYTGIGTGPRSLAVQGKTVTAVSGDGAASRMVALDRSGLPGYTVPNPAVDSAQVNLTVLQGQLSQATSQLALLQAEETERDDIMELLAHANTQAQYVEADTLETTQQEEQTYER